ncbi:MAG: DHH family phosphoesterase [Candidatus Cloacimonadaceae bacterium]
MKMRWQIKTQPGQPVWQQVLQARGLTDEVLHKTLDDLPDESLLSNIDKAAQRIRLALYRNEPLVIFGHDDPDGITSAYILYSFLEACGYQKHQYYIPNRNLEPHGIQPSFLNFAQSGNYPLVITVDNGISAYEGVEELNKMGCDVIVTDHHLVQPDQMPNAYAIVNPQLPDDIYPFKMLAGVGVTLMLIRYLGKILNHPIDPALYFWTAVGSIADKVPMTDLNRILIRFVLDNWQTAKDNTIDFLLRNFNRISSTTDKMNFIQFCSRLLANGREENGQHLALRFMLQVSDEKAHSFQILEEEKNKWEMEMNRIFKLMDTMMENFNGDAFIYLDDDDLIPYSLLGTAATYVVNNLKIPALMLKKKDHTLSCEGRCDTGFNMVEAFTACKDSLLQFGGHAKAAGFTMQPENYDKFIEQFHAYLQPRSEAIKQALILQVDAVLSSVELNNNLWQELELLLPYGQENPEPVLVITDCTIKKITALFSLDNGGMSFDPQFKGKIAIQLKGPNLIKILDYEPESA